MNRYIISLSYKGTRYSGWQRQTTNPKTVQEKLETVLLHINKKPVIASGASRTDSGVHALGQVAHCDIYNDIGCETVRDALNHFLRKV